MSRPEATGLTTTVDPLALALFGVRDHVRHHHGCDSKRGIGGHHFDAADECALANIIRRYGDTRAAEVLEKYAREGEADGAPENVVTWLRYGALTYRGFADPTRTPREP